MSGVLRQITDLQTLSFEELKERWREFYGTEPPRHNRTHLIKRLAYRLQELVYGGVSDATRSRLRGHLEEIGEDGLPTARAPLVRRQRKNGMPVAGTVLVREWQGERHEVTVVAEGVEYRGCRFRSLSAPARRELRQRHAAIRHLIEHGEADVERLDVVRRVRARSHR